MSHHHRDSDELSQRLRALVDHRIPDEVRTRHLAAIDAELVRRQPATSQRPVTTLLGWRARRWLAGLAAAATLVTPGMAVAAQGSLPGDTLYPVKRASEHVQALITRDVIAHHRVSELAALLDRDADPDTLAAAVDAARDAVAALSDDHPLHSELATLLARINEPPSTPDPDPAPPATADEQPEPDDDHRDDETDEPDDDETDEPDDDETDGPDDDDDETDAPDDDETDGPDDDETETDEPDDDSEIGDEPEEDDGALGTTDVEDDGDHDGLDEDGDDD